MKYTHNSVTKSNIFNILPHFSLENNEMCLHQCHTDVSNVYAAALFFFHPCTAALYFVASPPLVHMQNIFFLPVCQWLLQVQGSLLCQAECLGRGPQSSSGRVAHLHQSKKYIHVQIYLNKKCTQL